MPRNPERMPWETPPAEAAHKGGYKEHIERNPLTALRKLEGVLFGLDLSCERAQPKIREAVAKMHEEASYLIADLSDESEVLSPEDLKNDIFHLSRDLSDLLEQEDFWKSLPDHIPAVIHSRARGGAQFEQMNTNIKNKEAVKESLKTLNSRLYMIYLDLMREKGARNPKFHTPGKNFFSPAVGSRKGNMRRNS